MRRSLLLGIACCGAVLGACSGPKREGDSSMGDTTAMVPATTTAGAALSLADIAGRWDIRAVPETADTTPTTFVPAATADTSGWTVQDRSWWDREYGIGVVSYLAMGDYTARDVIRAAPSATADTVAVLTRDSLCFAPDHCVRSYDRMIEFDYEIPGWAILRFSEDSSWVQVTMAPSDSQGPTGWVALRGDSVQAVLWRDLLPEKPLFFLRPEDIAFYAAPSEAASIPRELARDSVSGQLDHIMNPLEARGGG